MAGSNNRRRDRAGTRLMAVSSASSAETRSSPAATAVLSAATAVRTCREA